jgi:hypothetical protein
MKCWKSAFNAQGSRIIIVALQVGAVKNYAARSGGAKEKGKTGVQTQSPQIQRSSHPWMLMFFLFMLNLTLFMIKLKVLVLFSLLYRQFYYIYKIYWDQTSCKVIWISCGYIFWCFFYKKIAMGHLAGLSSKILWNLPSSSKNHTLFIVILSDCVKFI